MWAIRQLATRETYEVTHPLTVEPSKQDLGEEDTLNKLADHVMSEECTASYGQAAKKKLSETVKGANVWEANGGAAYFIYNALTAMMSSGTDDGRP